MIHRRRETVDDEIEDLDEPDALQRRHPEDRIEVPALHR